MAHLGRTHKSPAQSCARPGVKFWHGIGLRTAAIVSCVRNHSSILTCCFFCLFVVCCCCFLGWVGRGGGPLLASASITSFVHGEEPYNIKVEQHAL